MWLDLQYQYKTQIHVVMAVAMVDKDVKKVIQNTIFLTAGSRAQFSL